MVKDHGSIDYQFLTDSRLAKDAGCQRSAKSVAGDPPLFHLSWRFVGRSFGWAGKEERDALSGGQQRNLLYLIRNIERLEMIRDSRVKSFAVLGQASRVPPDGPEAPSGWSWKLRGKAKRSQDAEAPSVETLLSTGPSTFAVLVSWVADVRKWMKRTAFNQRCWCLQLLSLRSWKSLWERLGIT